MKQISRFDVTDAGINETFVPLQYESRAEGAYGPGGHPPPEERDYSLARKHLRR
jgi:hypothetical protein